MGGKQRRRREATRERLACCLYSSASLVVAEIASHAFSVNDSGSTFPSPGDALMRRRVAAARRGSASGGAAGGRAIVDRRAMPCESGEDRKPAHETASSSTDDAVRTAIASQHHTTQTPLVPTGEQAAKDFVRLWRVVRYEDCKRASAC